MALIVPNVGEIELLKRMLDMRDPGLGGGDFDPRAGDIKLRLFENDPTLSDTTVLADLDEIEDDITGESGGGGDGEGTYDPIVLAPAGWGIVAGVAEHTEKTFTLDGGAIGYIVYGYHVTVEVSEETDIELLWVEKFPTPFNIQSTGGVIKITLKLELD